MAEKLKKTRWQSCNVLQPGADARQLWSFAAGKNGFGAGTEQLIPNGRPLPEKLVRKDWMDSLRRKLNIALLPVDRIFLRVVHLPVSSFDETLAMVELQLEKLSPLPVTHIVWSIQLLPHHVDNLQTVVVIIVARDIVDKLLGDLEGQGYLADRLEAPLVDQLLATPITADGAWIYPSGESGKFTALVAWWYGGVLRSLGLLHVPAVPNRGELLEEQLKQMTWAGELEGWLTAPPRWTLVADDATAKLWQPMFFSWLGKSVEVESPLSGVNLATATANRVARADTSSSIVPADYTTRYRQQHIDRLWLWGLGSALGVYLVAVFVYFVAMEIQSFRAQGVEAEARGLSRNYTNTMQLKAKLQVLQNRELLKFAFLDCWKTTAELLPEGLTLQNMNFRGDRVSLDGTAPSDQTKLITDFNEAMRKARRDDGQLMFQSVELATTRSVGANVTWSFSCDLARKEGQ